MESWAGRALESSKLTDYRWSIVEYKKQIGRFPEVESGKVDVIPGAVMDADVEMSHFWEELTIECITKHWESLMLWPAWETPNQVRARVGFWDKRRSVRPNDVDPVSSHMRDLTFRRRRKR